MSGVNRLDENRGKNQSKSQKSLKRDFEGEIVKDKLWKSAEGGIRTLESRRDTGLANLRHTRLGYLDSRPFLCPFNI